MKKHAWVFWLVGIALAFYFRTQLLAEIASLWATLKADFQSAGAAATAAVGTTTAPVTVAAAANIADTVAAGGASATTPTAPAPTYLVFAPPVYPILKQGRYFLQ